MNFKNGPATIFKTSSFLVAEIVKYNLHNCFKLDFPPYCLGFMINYPKCFLSIHANNLDDVINLEVRRS